MSLSALSERVYYSRGYLSKVETGRRTVSPQLAQRCDEALSAGGMLAGLAPEPARPRESQSRPAQLPGAIMDFTGRDTAISQLNSASGTHPVVVISGPPGVGKTTLATYWGHQVATEFPGGQLFVNLRGFDPSGTPMAPADTVLVLLEALGVQADRIPSTAQAQAGLYRSLLAGKRMLIVADNARDEAQVRPIVPGSLTCQVVVTSRNQLTGLAATDSARLLRLDVLTDAEASDLLRRRLGAERLSAEASAAAAIVRACANLPLALSIIAARAQAAPDTSLAQIAAELAEPPDLGQFSAGPDPAADIRSVLSWSYRQLDAPIARAFRLAGLHPGQDLDRYALAALTGTAPEHAGQVMAMLAHGSLVQPAGTGRYRMHDLLKGYARELADAQDGDEGRRAALTGLFDYYLQTTAAAVDIIAPAEREHRPRILGPAARIPALADPAAAQAWLDTERGSLTAVAAHAWPGYATQFSALLQRYLSIGCYHSEAIIIHSAARRVAREAGDKAAEGAALRSLGQVDLHQSRNQQAEGHFRQALDLYRQAGDRHGEADVHNNLGGLNWNLGHYQQAADHIRQALAVYREVGDRQREGRLLGNLGVVNERLGRLQEAADYHQQAMTLLGEIGDRDGQARALANLGVVEMHQGLYPQAADHVQQAIVSFRAEGDRIGEARAVSTLGTVELRQGRYQEAAGHLGQSLSLYRENGDLIGEAGALNYLGELCLATGKASDASTHHATALSLATQSGDEHNQADAHLGLGDACQAVGDHAQARRHWQHALTLSASLGLPQADQIRTRLAQD